MTEDELNIAWEELEAEILTSTPEEISELAAIPEDLVEVLGEVEEIEIIEAAGLSGSERPTRAHWSVCIVDQILQRCGSSSRGIAFFIGAFFYFTGRYWAELGVPIVRRFLLEAGIRSGFRRVDAKHHYFVDELEKQFRSTVQIEQPELHAEKYLLNFLNGTLEIEGGVPVFRPHRKEDMLTNTLNCDYDEHATCEDFQRALDRVSPDKASQDNLAEFCGSMFTNFKHEKALVLLGDGHNGKSAVMDIICDVVGQENVAHQSLDSLDREYSRAVLAGKLLNYSSEIGRNPKPEILKKMVSGEPIDVRLPYKAPYTMRRYARLAFNANQMPVDVEHTEGFFRRLLIIPFSVRITPEERDPYLAKKIAQKEASGIMNWMIAGLLRLIEQQGFTPNPVSDAAVEQYRLESNSVALFTAEAAYTPVTYSKRSIRASRLYEDYRDFCRENGYVPVSRHNMIRRLRNLEFTSVHKNTGTYYYVGDDVDTEEKVRY